MKRHVAVIGAGPAGSVAAILLTRAGIDVTLIEQHTFPRDKVCGECLSALGIEVLQRHHLERVIQSLHPTILTQSAIYADDGSCVEIPLPRPMWGISRLSMDDALLEQARREGAMILQPARCEAIEPDPKPTLRVRILQTNEVRNLNADYILVADGKGALLPGQIKPTDDFGFKAHFTSVAAPAQTIELFGVQGHYGGIAPIENEKWNIAFSVPAQRIKSANRDFDGLFQQITHENAALERQMRNAARISDWQISPLPRFAITQAWSPGIIPIGNAAAALEPIGGEGMGLAIRSAELAASEIIRAAKTNQNVNSNGLRAAYRKIWNIKRVICRTAAILTSSPRLARLAIRLAANTHGPATLALRLIGK